MSMLGDSGRGSRIGRLKYLYLVSIKMGGPFHRKHGGCLNLLPVAVIKSSTNSFRGEEIYFASLSEVPLSILAACV